MSFPQKPDRIDFTLLRVRTDLAHTPSWADRLTVDRKDVADILAYVEWLESEYENAMPELSAEKDDE
jgi:hypothetical protein